MPKEIHSYEVLRRPVVTEKSTALSAQRKYVFVGDSRERDPETYAKLCHQFPGQISAIFIREWEDRPLAPERMEKIAHYCGETVCYAFRSADELLNLGEPIFGAACAAY